MTRFDLRTLTVGRRLVVEQARRHPAGGKEFRTVIPREQQGLSRLDFIITCVFTAATVLAS